MLTKKSFPALAIICLVITSATVLTGCPASTTDKTASDTTSTMQDTSSMQAAPMDTSMMMDTSAMDTASTRPVKNPHK